MLFRCHFVRIIETQSITYPNDRDLRDIVRHGDPDKYIRGLKNVLVGNRLSRFALSLRMKNVKNFQLKSR